MGSSIYKVDGPNSRDFDVRFINTVKSVVLADVMSHATFKDDSNPEREDSDYGRS